MSSPTEITSGPWAGWKTWPHDNFETHAGPFYSQMQDGEIVNRFIAEPRHINGGGSIHGGCLLTFADYCCFTIADAAIAGRAVTVNLSGDFLSAGKLGDVMEGRGEVTKSGGSMIYVRGLITASGKPCLSFTSVLYRMKPSSPAGKAPAPA